MTAGVRLARKGIHAFTIFEQSEQVGGTWWDNRYPGAEVDTNSLIYSFGFKPFNWTRTHAGQAELLDYIQETVNEYGLREHLRLSCRVEEVIWCDDVQQYRLRTSSGDALMFDFVISAVGFLNVPQYPDWPGLASFDGPAFHTARWEPEHDLAGRVAVAGSGSSASQVVPALAEVAAEVWQFQREPGWVRPRATGITLRKSRGIYPSAAQIPACRAVLAIRVASAGRSLDQARNSRTYADGTTLPQPHRQAARRATRPAGAE